MLDISLARFMEHVVDLEEWNEEAGFDWGTPTIVHNDPLVMVVHPFTLPKWDSNPPGRESSMAIALYQQDGTEIALWVVDGDGSGQHADTNYWTTPDGRRAFQERTAVFRGFPAAVGDTVWDEKTGRVWTCTKIAEKEANHGATSSS